MLENDKRKYKHQELDLKLFYKGAKMRKDLP